MGTSATIALWSGITSLVLIILFSIEARRGVRFGESLRAVFDRLILRIRGVYRAYIPEVNSLFLQELFFYSLHLILSRFLAGVRKLERLVLRIVRFNRTKAMRLRAQTGVVVPPAPEHDQHLALIAEHKEATKLTEKEKVRHKEAAIEGNGPSKK